MERLLLEDDFIPGDAERLEKARALIKEDIERIKNYTRDTIQRVGYLRNALLERLQSALRSVFVTDLSGNRYPVFDLSKTEVNPVQMTGDCMRDFRFILQWTQQGIAFYRPVKGKHPLLDSILNSVINLTCV